MRAHGDSVRAFSDNDGAQAPSQLARQTPSRARESLRALIESVCGEKNYADIIHKMDYMLRVTSTM